MQRNSKSRHEGAHVQGGCAVSDTSHSVCFNATTQAALGQTCLGETDSSVGFDPKTHATFARSDMYVPKRMTWHTVSRCDKSSSWGGFDTIRPKYQPAQQSKGWYKGQSDLHACLHSTNHSHLLNTPCRKLKTSFLKAGETQLTLRWKIVVTSHFIFLTNT